MSRSQEPPATHVLEAQVLPYSAAGIRDKPRSHFPLCVFAVGTTRLHSRALARSRHGAADDPEPAISKPPIRQQQEPADFSIVD